MYAIEWTVRASNGLAMICLAHPNEWADIDAAENVIFGKLQRDPFPNSQEVSEGLRKIVQWPLVAYFSIRDQIVEIDAVGWIG